jgi:hypothetical protein
MVDGARDLDIVEVLPVKIEKGVDEIIEEMCPDAWKDYMLAFARAIIREAKE